MSIEIGRKNIWKDCDEDIFLHKISENTFA